MYTILKKIEDTYKVPVKGVKNDFKMINFTSVKDVSNISKLVNKVLEIKKNPQGTPYLGKGKTLGLIFMNPSLRTRLSTQKAAMNLGMNVLNMNFNSESWQLELEDGAVMNLSSQEHIKDAVKVISTYCDVIAFRSFPGMKNKKEDLQEILLNKFLNYSDVPVISLESSTLHPLQSLADMATLQEMRLLRKPKIVLTWAPHPKAVPQVVANSFAEWVNHLNADFVITHPKGFELEDKFTGNAVIEYDQNVALKDADFVYVKSWTSSENYGVPCEEHHDWTITKEKMELTDNAYVMHCMPIRRNVEVTDEVLDGPYSLIYQQAKNREFAAQAVLSEILKNEICKSL